MMSTRIREEIICITTRNDSRAHCSHIMWVSTDLNHDYTVADVIRLIQLGTHEFFVRGDIEEEAIVDAVPHDNPTYIRTEADDSPFDNLLNLAFCPFTFRN